MRVRKNRWCFTVKRVIINDNNALVQLLSTSLACCTVLLVRVNMCDNRLDGEASAAFSNSQKLSSFQNSDTLWNRAKRILSLSRSYFSVILVCVKILNDQNRLCFHIEKKSWKIDLKTAPFGRHFTSGAPVPKRFLLQP